MKKTEEQPNSCGLGRERAACPDWHMFSRGCWMCCQYDDRNSFPCALSPITEAVRRVMRRID